MTEKKKFSWKREWKRNGIAYLLLIPTLVYLIIFNYIPMAGILMAFEKYRPAKGIFGSEWVGFANFIELFSGEEFPRALRNTVAMALLNLTIGFISPIIFAFLLSLLKSKKYKRTVQTMSYMPNFVAAVVICALITEFLGKDGALTQFFTLFGAPEQNWLANTKIPVFWLINTFSGIWCGIGWGSIMYVAAISNVNGELHEAAAIDGANRFKRVIHITIPCIMPIIVMNLTLQVGVCFIAGFDKILLLYMPSTYEVADCISTYTYRLAFSSTANYGLSTASSLFQSLVGTVLLIVSNYLNKRASGMSLF